MSPRAEEPKERNEEREPGRNEEPEQSADDGHVLRRLRAGGRLESTRRFTLDPGAENQKLLEQVRDPDGALSDKVFELTFQHLDPFLQQLELARQPVPEEFSPDPEVRQQEQERREKFLEEAGLLAQPWADALSQLIPRLSKRLKSAWGHLHKPEPTYFTDSGEERAVVLFSDKLAEFRQLVRETHLSRGLWYAGAAQGLALYRTSLYFPWTTTPKRYAAEVATLGRSQGLTIELLGTLIEHSVTDYLVGKESKVPRVRRYAAMSGGIPKSEALFSLHEKGIGASDYAVQMMEGPAFEARSSAAREHVRFIGLDFSDLMLESDSYWHEIDRVRGRLALDRCLVDDAVAILLHTPPDHLSVRTGIIVFSDQIASNDSAYPTVTHLDLFMIGRSKRVHRPGLGHRRVEPGYGFYPGHELIFRLHST